LQEGAETGRGARKKGAGESFMFRRFSTNFAIFSIFLDGLLITLALGVAHLLRPIFNVFEFFRHLSRCHGLWFLFSH
jgi:hypothetical protein